MRLEFDEQLLRRETADAVKQCGRLGLSGITDAAILHGNGNIIAIVEVAGDSSGGQSPLAETSRTLCQSIHEIRVDGVLYFYPDARQGPRMVFLDRDGTWEAMCGNGLRCLTKYAYDTRRLSVEGVIVTDDGAKPVRMIDGQAEVSIGEPREVRQVRPNWWFLYNGVPHLVLFVHRLDDIDVRTDGARLRYDRELCALLNYPDGVHVDFASIDGDRLKLRTYEVGVEDETLSCGTGAAAAGYLGWWTGRSPIPVEVGTAGGTIRVELRGRDVSIRGEVSYAMHPLVGAWPACSQSRLGSLP